MSRQASRAGECSSALILCGGISPLCPPHPCCCALLRGSEASPLFHSQSPPAKGLPSVFLLSFDNLIYLFGVQVHYQIYDLQIFSPCLLLIFSYKIPFEEKFHSLEILSRQQAEPITEFTSPGYCFSDIIVPYCLIPSVLKTCVPYIFVCSFGCFIGKVNPVLVFSFLNGN